MAENFPVPWSASRASGSNAVGTSPIQVLTNNGQRAAVIFHNPGTINIYVYSSQVSPPPSLAALGGSWLVLPGGDRTVYGGNTISLSAVNGQWFAFASSGSANPLSVIEMTL